MNKKQLVVLWSSAILLCIAVVLSTYVIWFNEKPNTLDALLSDKGQWCMSRANSIDIVFVNLIRYLSPILIIGGLLLYSLRSKNK